MGLASNLIRRGLPRRMALGAVAGLGSYRCIFNDAHLYTEYMCVSSMMCIYIFSADVSLMMRIYIRTDVFLMMYTYMQSFFHDVRYLQMWF